MDRHSVSRLRPQRALAALLLLGAALVSCVSPVETVFLPDEEPWKGVHAGDDGHQTIAEYVPVAETLANWREMCTVQALDDRARFASVEEICTRLEADMRQRCPGTEWHVIESAPARILYEWSVHDCGQQPDQGEVAMLVRGRDSYHRVAYAHRYLPLPPERRERWIGILRRARVVKGADEVRAARAELLPLP